MMLFNVCGLSMSAANQLIDNIAHRYNADVLSWVEELKVYTIVYEKSYQHSLLANEYSS